jgi:8-oxo-dGTP pyrophosphatase MutT (NUDIX family)
MDPALCEEHAVSRTAELAPPRGAGRLAARAHRPPIGRHFEPEEKRRAATARIADATRQNAFAARGALLQQGLVISAAARQAISDYLPDDPRERGFRQRMLQLLEQDHPTSRASFRPGHLTASGFVLSPERDAVLLIFHKKLGIWVQPGGHIEPSDVSLEGAARRELAEEVGLSLPENAAATIFDLDIHSIPARKDEPEHEHFDVRYRFQSPTRELVASDEVAGVRWAELARIDQLTTDESVLRAVRKLSRVAQHGVLGFGDT